MDRGVDNFPASTRWFRPAGVLVDAFTFVDDAIIGVNDEGIIVYVGSIDECLPHGCEIGDYSEEMWVAAPIMMHAHLESFDAPSSQWQRDDFSTWVRDLLEWRQSPRLSFKDSVKQSLNELGQNGCGLVLASASDGEPQSINQDHQGIELIHLQELFAPEAESNNLLEVNPVGEITSAIALHAPFSINAKLAKKVFANYEFVSIHLGEHADERQALQAKGRLAEMLEARTGERTEIWDSPVQWLQEMGGCRAGTLAVHGGDLTSAELQTLHQSGVAMVWCPGTHQYFNRVPPKFAEAGIPAPMLGCDSKASNYVLDPLLEFELACQMIPEYSPQQWWDSLTSVAADYLRKSDIGRLQVGCKLRVLRLKSVLATTPAEICGHISKHGREQRLGSLILA